MSSVHGDDFTTAGPKFSLDAFVEEFCKKFALKEAARPGPAPEDDKEARVLNRAVRRSDHVCVHVRAYVSVDVFRLFRTC